MHLKAELTLTHATLRREKSGPNRGPLMSDLAMSGSLQASQLQGLFATAAGYQAVLGGLYRDDGELVTGDLSELALAAEGTGVKAVLLSPLDGRVLATFATGAKLNKLCLTPKAGRLVELTARLQVPSAGQLEVLGELLEQTVQVSIEAQQTSLQLEGGGAQPETPAAAKPKQRRKVQDPQPPVMDPAQNGTEPEPEPPQGHVPGYDAPPTEAPAPVHAGNGHSPEDEPWKA